jgi:hypothetical protein
VLDYGQRDGCASGFAGQDGLDILLHLAAVGSARVRAYAEEASAQDSAMFAINADGALKVCQTFLSVSNSLSPYPGTA